MAHFIDPALDGVSIRLVLSFDPAIDWPATIESGMTKDEYKENPTASINRLVKKDGCEFIELEILPPTTQESIVAMSLAGVDVDTEGGYTFQGSKDLPSGLRNTFGSSLVQPYFALLCITDAFNLDNWPSPCRHPHKFGTHILTEEAVACFGSDRLKDMILQEAGKVIVELSTLGNSTLSESGQSPSGHPSSDGKNTPTDANSAEIQTSDDNGDVTDQQNHHDPDEMTQSDTI